MREMLTAVLLFLGWLSLWRWSNRQLQYGMDAPLHFEALAARNNLNAPWFGPKQSVPGTRWAYIGPRSLLLLFWPLQRLWDGSRLAALMVWTMLGSHLPLVAAFWLLCPRDGLGLWFAPFFALFLWSMDENGQLGTAHGIGILLVAAAYVVPNGVWAWFLFGLAVDIRVIPLLFLPAVWAFHPVGMLEATGFISGLLVLRFTADAFGFGHEPWRKLWRLARAVQFGRHRQHTALHKRPAYPVYLVLLLPWPGLCFVASVVWLAYVVLRLGTVRGTRDGTALDFAGGLWTEDWQDKA